MADQDMRGSSFSSPSNNFRKALKSRLCNISNNMLNIFWAIMRKPTWCKIRRSKTHKVLKINRHLVYCYCQCNAICYATVNKNTNCSRSLTKPTFVVSSFNIHVDCCSADRFAILQGLVSLCATWRGRRGPRSSTVLQQNSPAVGQASWRTRVITNFGGHQFDKYCLFSANAAVLKLLG